MLVSKINTIRSLKFANNTKKALQVNAGGFVNFSTPNQYSAEKVRANFIPSFCAYKRAGKTEIIDRKTGQKVSVDVKKDVIGPYTTYKIYDGKKEAGFLTMRCDTRYPVADHVITFATDNVPKIINLRTIEGEKYSGIGTALIKTAIQESYNSGCYGNLWLNSEKGYEKKLSKYRSNENPIPFYYKVGFRSPYEELNQEIEKNLKANKINGLPNVTTLLLTPEARDKWLEELSREPIIKFKKYSMAC